MADNAEDETLDSQANTRAENFAEEIISNYKTEITLPHEDFKKYLSENISYSIDDSMQKGLALYFKLAHKNGLCENNSELRFLNL